MMAQDVEPALLQAAASREPKAVWAIVGEALLGDEWRLTMGVRGWIRGYSILVRSRIGSVAQMNGLNGSPWWRMLEATIPLPSNPSIGEFPDLESVKGHLASEFTSGSWTGPTSGRYGQQIAHLEGWAADTSLPRAVRDWASTMAADIRQMRSAHYAWKQKESSESSCLCLWLTLEGHDTWDDLHQGPDIRSSQRDHQGHDEVSLVDCATGDRWLMEQCSAHSVVSHSKMRLAAITCLANPSAVDRRYVLTPTATATSAVVPKDDSMVGEV